MATALTVLSDRMAAQTVLQGVTADANGDQNIAYSLPTGFGDCLLLECFVQITQVATLMANPQINGPQITIVVESVQNNDFVGTAYWVMVGALAMSCHIKPDQPVVWKSQECLALVFAEVDTNASPTADIRVLARVRRLRQI